MAKTIDQELTLHNTTRIDPYFWMKNCKDPEVIEHLHAENRHLEVGMEHTKPLQKKIYDEMLGRLEEDHVTYPYRNGDWLYYTREVKGLEHPIYCRKGLEADAKEQIILDINELAPKYDYCKALDFEPSPDGKLLAYVLDTEGTQSGTLFVKNLVTDEIIESEEIPDVSDNLAWSNDGTSFLYVGINEMDRRDKIGMHKLGTDPKEDRILFQEDDEEFDLYLDKSRDERYFTITSDSKTTSDVRTIRTDDPQQELHLFHPREEGLKYSVEPYTEGFMITTKQTGQNYYVMKTESNNTAMEHWQPFRPLDENVDIEDVEAFQNFLVIEKREKGNVGYEVYNLVDGSVKEIEFPDECYDTWIGSNYLFDTVELRYGYQSPTTPTSVYTYDMEKGVSELKQRDKAGTDFNPANYETKRILAVARDGTEIPISLFHRKEIQLDGSHPLKLYGYGSYGVVLESDFSSEDISLADRGVICAVAHIRGGGFLGQKWYEDGKLMKKKNTFFDFVDSAEYLIEQGYTSKEKLVIQGGSAGGLLMGAVMNERPDLFKAVIAEVPFVDVITTMLDESIPLTTQEYSEWGDPREKEAFDYMLSYSPYDNVKRAEYPSMFITGGLNDHQVGYWEPAKWTAKLRAMKLGDNPIYLKTNMSAGHHSCSGRYDEIKEDAEVISFMLDQVGIAE